MIKLNRWDIINIFIETRFKSDCNYLEIGVRNFEDCFNKIKASKKTSVDPGKETAHVLYDYNLTSDDFFFNLKNNKTEFAKDHKWDIIFIDGLHLATQSYKDIINSIDHTHDKSVIVLHDCSPPIWWQAHSDYDYFINNQHCWNGSVWKSLYYFKTISDYDVYTVDTDEGCGVIDKSRFSEKIQHTNFFFEYGVMSKNRKNDLGLISVEEFLRSKL